MGNLVDPQEEEEEEEGPVEVVERKEVDQGRTGGVDCKRARCRLMRRKPVTWQSL